MPDIRKLYRQERSKGWRADHALRNARTRAAWQERDWDEISDPEPGEVRLRIEPDETPYDASYVDTWHETPERRERIKSEIYERCNHEGVWGVIGEYFDGRDWEHADSCWGFIGEDWRDSGYDTDIMAAALEQGALANLDSRIAADMDGGA